MRSLHLTSMQYMHRVSVPEKKLMGSVSAADSASADAPSFRNSPSFEGRYTKCRLPVAGGSTEEQLMSDKKSALELRIPRSQTALMQLLQLDIVNGYRWWCGGEIAAAKAIAFADKFSSRYPVLRSERGRAYDRKKGFATCHLVFYPLPNGKLAWWLMSTEGRGGLADPTAPDVNVARHAMAANGHITFGDYLLHYATKRERRKLVNAMTGKMVAFDKEVSTWTWKITDWAYNEVKSSIERAANGLQYGSEQEGTLWGVLGILACQRSRPLFAGVRNQVVELHRYAATVWDRVRPKWRAQHGQLVANHGDCAGALRPVGEVLVNYLPKMRRLPVYGVPARTLSSLLAAQE